MHTVKSKLSKCGRYSSPPPPPPRRRYTCTYCVTSGYASASSSSVSTLVPIYLFLFGFVSCRVAQLSAWSLAVHQLTLLSVDPLSTSNTITFSILSY